MQLAALVHGGAEPVDAGITTDGLVVGINENDLIVLVHTIGVDPVRVQHTKVGATGSNTLLGLGTQRALPLEVVDTLLTGLTVNDTLLVRALAVTTADADAVDDVALLGLVT